MLKRCIVILLILFVVVGGGIAVYFHGAKRFRGDPGDAPFTVTKVELKRDFANAILTLTVDYDNREGRDEVLTAAVADDPNRARLVTTTGKAPALFFLPGIYPPVVKAGERKDITVIYWLDDDHLREGLNFESKGKHIAVKNDAPFDLNQVENQQSAIFTDPNWDN